MYIEDVIGNHIKEFVQKQDEFVIDKLNKQKGFVSIEESKHLIEVNKMMQNGHWLGTDYIFNGRRFLTIYPPEFNETQRQLILSFNYLEYDE